MEKKFDAVKMVRDIRDRMHEQTKKMPRVQLLEFYRSKSRRVSSRAGSRVKVAVS